VLKTLLKKNKKKLFFSLLHFFLCADMRNNFLKIKKKIIFMHFQAKSNLKSNRYNTLKHSLNMKTTKRNIFEVEKD
jgi:hypothetical protein